jgi:hypothetical protein
MRIPQEHDDFSPWGVLMAALIVTVIAAAFVLMAWGIDACDRRATATPWTTIPEEINEIEVASFDEPTAAERSVGPARERLRGYGWLDQQADVAHIPIAEAIEIYLTRKEAR